MGMHEHTVVVDRPLPVVYEGWTRMEDYPLFMSHVEMVQPIDDETTHWLVRIGGVEREFDATITLRRPREVIAWQSLHGVTQGGRVAFTPLGPSQTRVSLMLEFQPDGVVETLGDGLGIIASTTEESLEAFKQFIEADRV